MDDGLATLFVVILVIYAIYWLIVNVIMPLAGIAATVVFVVAVIYAFYESLKAFCIALMDNKDPYAKYVDRNPNAISGVKRGYFFGPGLKQMMLICRDSVSNLLKEAENVTKLKRRYLTAYYNRSLVNFFLRDLWVYLFWLIATLSIYILGFMWLAVFCIALSSVLASGALTFYVCFSILWAADRLMLFVKSIQSRCPNCKRVSIIPLFACPKCGRRHDHLTPGPYGIFHIKCTCGNLLPLTAFNGRSELSAYCPYCNEPLVTAAASQFGIQIAGSISSGKTTFLSAFWNSYKKMLSRSPDIVSFSVSPEDAFTELERWYSLGISSSTSETNASMYSIIHSMRADNTPYQLSLYDIAGEAFEQLSSDVQQQQFKYCEGVIMIIDSDPKAKPDDTLESFSGFIQEMKRLKGISADKILNIPAAIVISKADIHLSDIGPAKIDEDFRAQTEKTVWEVQDDICRKFLNRRGYSHVLNLIDASLSRTRIFPVSSMGHQADGTKYTSWGVLNPVLWIMSENNCKLYKFLKP